MDVFSIGNGKIVNYWKERSKQINDIGYLTSAHININSKFTLRDFDGRKFDGNWLPLSENGAVVFGVKAVSKFDKAFKDSLTHLLEVIYSRGYVNLVCLSSAAVYGELQGESFSEDFRCRPTTAYGRQKYEIEELLRTHAPQNSKFLRISNIFGLPEMNTQSYLDTLIKSLKDSHRFRSDLSFDSIRDYISLDFLAQCIDKIIATDSRWILKTEILNISSSNPTSLADLVSLFRSNGLECDPQVAHDRNIIERSVLNSQKILNLYNLRYTQSRFERDIKRALIT